MRDLVVARCRTDHCDRIAPRLAVLVGSGCRHRRRQQHRRCLPVNEAAVSHRQHRVAGSVEPALVLRCDREHRRVHHQTHPRAGRHIHAGVHRREGHVQCPHSRPRHHPCRRTVGIRPRHGPDARVQLCGAKRRAIRDRPRRRPCQRRHQPVHRQRCHAAGYAPSQVRDHHAVNAHRVGRHRVKRQRRAGLSCQRIGRVEKPLIGQRRCSAGGHTERRVAGRIHRQIRRLRTDHDGSRRRREGERLRRADVYAAVGCAAVVAGCDRDSRHTDHAQGGCEMHSAWCRCRGVVNEWLRGEQCVVVVRHDEIHRL